MESYFCYKRNGVAILKINVLSYALTVEECGSLNKAAAKLYISQPNLSLAIQSLEKELGYPVFNRTNQGVSLTEKGEEFIVFAKNILNNYEKMINVRNRFGKIQYHIITAASSILEEPFYTLCTEYQEYPHFQFSLTHNTAIALLEAVYKGTCELGVLLYSNGQKSEINELAAKYHLVIEHIKTVTCNINFREGHPALEENFQFEQLWNYPFVDYTGSGFFSYHEIGGANLINPARIIFVDERELRCRLVSRTNAYSIDMPLSRGEQNWRRWISIPFPGLQINIAYAHKEGHSLDSISRQYLKLLNNELMSCATSGAFEASVYKPL